MEFLLVTLQRNAALWRRVERAELIGDEVRVTGNYSSNSRQIGGPGWVLVGDAFAFIDPVPSGVYLAMCGAEQAAATVDAALREPASERRLLRRLEKRQRACIRQFSFFIYRFNGPVMGQLFRQPSNRLQLEQGVISMLAGDLFDTPQVLRRLRLFRLVYALGYLREWRRRDARAIGSPRRARIHRRHDAARSGVTQVQATGFLRRAAPQRRGRRESCTKEAAMPLRQHSRRARSARPPDSYQPRACDCEFCRKHGAA